MKHLLFSALLISTAAMARPVDENSAVLLDGQREIVSLTEMSQLGLSQGETTLDLWSGSYWPVFQGSLGFRYRDPDFIRQSENGAQWAKFKELYQQLPLYSYSGKENSLSPAEKYDLLVGDQDLSLTRYAWTHGEKDASGGKIKIWRGVCDGWASATQKMPRPVRSVKLKTPSGVAITFYPEDIKALGSLMYARSQESVIMVGKRCRPGIGLFTGSCEETNPGTFHKAIVNRVGKLKKTFIADVSPGGQVWNYPIASYKLVYYNVFNHEESASFEKVKELFSSKKRFRSANTRHSNTHSIVGVKIDVKYRDMRDANLLDTDSPSQDKIKDMTYVYDLELDANNNIIGGESFSKNLPDFIWLPNDQTYPLSDAEEDNLNLSVLELAKAASQKGQPLSRVVQKLFEAAKN